MAALLDLWIDLVRQKRVAGPANAQEVPLPTFTQGNIWTFRVRCLQQLSGFPLANPPYSVVPTAGKTLQLAIGTKTGGTTTHYVEQFTWTASTNLADPYFQADVTFDATATGSLIGTNPSAQSWLEINLVTDGVPKTILSQLVTIEASVIKNTTPTVPLGQTPISLETALALFLQRVIVGKVTFRNDTDPTKQRDLYTDIDGSFHEDPS